MAASPRGDPEGKHGKRMRNATEIKGCQKALTFVMKFASVFSLGMNCIGAWDNVER
jgi:hypothetical protein